MGLRKKFVQWLLADQNWKIIEVKSWRISFDHCDGFGIAWPTLLVDDRNGQRWTITPILNRTWFRNRFLGGVGD